MRLISGAAARAGVASAPASSPTTCLRSIMCISGVQVKLAEQTAICDTHDTKKTAHGFNTMARICDINDRFCGIWDYFVEPRAECVRLTGKLPKPGAGSVSVRVPHLPADRTMPCRPSHPGFRR